MESANEETRLKEHCDLLLQGSRLWKAQMKKLGRKRTLLSAQPGKSLVESANEETRLSFQNFGKKFGKHIDLKNKINKYLQ